jgi:hypothetical protein
VNRLMLCAGSMRRAGWQTLDADAKHAPDFLATIPPLPDAVKAQRWDEIEWVHGIASLYPWDAGVVLREILGALAPGGKLVLEQPDMRKAAGNPRWLFGDPAFREPLHMNKWAYTPETLFDLLKEVGFGRVEIILPAQYHVPTRDFRMEAFA